MMHWYLLVIALVQLVRGCTPTLPAGAATAAAATADDYTILSINLATNATDAATGAIHEVKATFVLRYSVVVAGGWRQAVTEDFRSTPFAGDIPQVHAYIENELARHGFHPDVVQHGTPLLEAEGLLRVEGLYTHGAVHQLVQTAAAAALPALVREQAGHHDNDNNRRRRRRRGRVLFTARREVGAAANPLDDARDVTAEMQGAHDAAPWNRPSVLPHFLRYPDPPAPYRPPRILIYQTRGVYTGGTVALELLGERLIALGYRATICNTHNMHSEECGRPSPNDIAVTGEWCHEVLEDYLSEPSSSSTGTGSAGDGKIKAPRNEYGNFDVPSLFPGRGVQYHLGFHHFLDSCRGHVAVTDSHFLHASLGDRVLGAYYLGCAMTERFKRSFGEQWGRDTTATRPPVAKENLVVVDGDLAHYPPEHDVDVPAPDGARVVTAGGFSPEQMQLLLLRAKVVVDLAMPGPERLSGEGVLSGAVPLVSHRWNGASLVDFPGLARVDHQNGTEVAAAVEVALRSYHHPAPDPPRPPDNTSSSLTSTTRMYSQLNRRGTGEFLAYVLSMWRRVHHTADIFFGSAHVHFVLRATSLVEETMACFQLLALLHLFPMASVDLYVRDVKWFARHHYAFYNQLRRAGYIQSDPFDPSHEAEVRHVWANPLHTGREPAYDTKSGSGPASGAGAGLGPKPSRVTVRHEGVLLTLMHHAPTAAARAADTAQRVCDCVVSPPWAPVVVAIPLPTHTTTSPTTGGQHDIEAEGAEAEAAAVFPVFADPFDLLDAVAAGLAAADGMFTLTLPTTAADATCGLDDHHCTATAAGSGADQPVAAVVAGPHASLEAFLHAASTSLLRDDELAAFRATRGQDDGNGDGDGKAESGLREAPARQNVVLEADQWRDVCALLYPPTPPSEPFPGTSSEPFSSPPQPLLLPSLVDGVVATPAWVAARALLNDLGAVERTLCLRHRHRLRQAQISSQQQQQQHRKQGVDGASASTGVGNEGVAVAPAPAPAPTAMAPAVEAAADAYMAQQDRMIAERFLKSYS